MGAVILTNSDRGGELIADVLHDIAQAYDWPESEDPPSSASPIQTSMVNCVGSYQFRSGLTCKIVDLNHKLYLEMSSQPPVPLTAISDTVYVLKPLEGEVIFLTDGDGIVRGLQLRQDGSELETDKVS